MNLQVTFREVPHSDAIEAYVRRKAEKLPTFYDRITSCRVAIESPHNHRRHGKLYRVRVDMGVPGTELVAGDDPRFDDAYAAIDDAFDAARRLLLDWVQRRRGDVKYHGPVTPGAKPPN